MPIKKQKKPAPPAMTIKPEVLDQLVQGPLTPEQFDSMFRGLKKAESLIERQRLFPKPGAALAAEEVGGLLTGVENRVLLGFDAQRP